MESGLPQGIVLVPVFVLVYINDLPDYISNGASARLFSDYSALFKEIKSAEDAKLLQQDLTNLQVREKQRLMEFHPMKCHVPNISNKRQPVRYSYEIDGHTIENAKSAQSWCSSTHTTQLKYPYQQNSQQGKLNISLHMNR